MDAPTLEILTGDLSGRRYAVDDDTFLIGRSTGCHIVIPKRYVSRQHARICREGGDYIVDGLSATNPVRISDRPIREHLLTDGDVFEFCGIKIRFRLPEGAGAQGAGKAPPAAAPAKDSWQDADPKGSWRDADEPQGSWSDADDAEDSWRDAPAADAAGDSWRDVPAARGRASEDSWRDAPARRLDEVPSDSGWETPPPSHAAAPVRASGVVFGDPVEAADDSGEGTGELPVEKLATLSARGSGSGEHGESANEQTAELNKRPKDLDDPDYDPFAEVEATKRKDRQGDPARDKMIKFLSLLGLLGIVLSVVIYKEVTKPKPWSTIMVEPAITVAVGQVIRFEEPWAGTDPPDGAGYTTLSGKPNRLIENDPVAEVEWVVPHVKGRALLLIQGLEEGSTKFTLTFPASRRVKVFQVNVEGANPHDIGRDKRREELRKAAPRSLEDEIRRSKASAETFTARREFTGKESFYREAWKEYAKAVDAAMALRAKGAGFGEKDLAELEEREQKAREDYEGFVDREFAIYRNLVSTGEAPEERIEQLRRVLRAISHTCDVRYKRLGLILTEYYNKRPNTDGSEHCELDAER